MINRRRVLAVLASFAALPAQAVTQSWKGQAFGADVSIDLSGPREVAEAALDEARLLIQKVERLFSLYDPTSELVRLNAQGHAQVSERFAELLTLADAAYHLTDGLFDPSVQPLWRALANEEDTVAARALVGWDKVRIQGRRVQLGTGQALTFNGIAQGYATDLVTDVLRQHGFSQTLVNIGEHRGLGGPWRLGLEDPIHGFMGTRTITGRAVATSSPMATPLGGAGHIVQAQHMPRWSTVSIEAESAAMADALSTGLVFANTDLIREIRISPGVHRITLVNKGGDLVTI